MKLLCYSSSLKPALKGIKTIKTCLRILVKLSLLLVIQLEVAIKIKMTRLWLTQRPKSRCCVKRNVIWDMVLWMPSIAGLWNGDSQEKKKKKKRSYMRQTSRGHLVLCLKAESTNLLSFLPDAYLTCSENSPEILRLP